MAWTLIGTYDVATSGALAEITFTGLSGYQDLAMIGRDLTTSSSGYRVMQPSVDGGSTWIGTTSSDIVDVSSTGTLANSGQIGGHSGAATTGARSIFGVIIGSNTASPWKIAQSNLGNKFVKTASAIDAMRIYASAGTINGGFVYLYGRT